MKNAVKAAASRHFSARLLALAVLACLAALPQARAQAQAPAQIPIQGFLTNDAGAPITGSHSLLFALFDAESGGIPIYTETQSVMIEGGFFTAYLGDTSALSLALFRDHGSVHLGVSIDGGSELSPRTAFGTVPYAAYAEYAGNGASAGSMAFTGTTPTNTPATIKAFSVTAPSAGMLTVMVTASAFVDCDSATVSSRVCSTARVGICTAPDVLSNAACGGTWPVWHEDPDSTTSSNEEHLITIARTIAVSAAGRVDLSINGQGPEATKRLALSSGVINVVFTSGPPLSVTDTAATM